MKVDIAVVGAGPAGAASALGALREDPSLEVALLDRARFPRDKACGDGVAPQVIDLLEAAGVRGVTDGLVPVHRLRLTRGTIEVERDMTRPAWVVPRTLFDQRLVAAAADAGGTVLHHRVRTLQQRRRAVVLDDLEARIVIAADGAHSTVRRALGHPRGPTALALRGYAPTSGGRTGAQVITFGSERQPSYAWSFDRGDGTANVGYGELLTTRRPAPSRQHLLERLEHLLPGASEGASDWRGHPLPLSGWAGPALGTQRVLLTGDAAGLVNPMTGEGIYYAVATGLLAGRAAAAALRADDGHTAVDRYSRAVRRELAAHLKHTAVAARLCLSGRVLDAGIRAASRDQRVFDDLTELGLAKGRITLPMALALIGSMVGAPTGQPPASTHQKEQPCEY